MPRCGWATHPSVPQRAEVGVHHQGDQLLEGDGGGPPQQVLRPGGVGNQATQILALATVLAEKERLRRDAAEQARLMRLILDSMTEGVLVVDRDRRVLLQNRSTMALAPAEIGSSIVGRAEQFGLCHPDGKTLLSPEDGPLFRAANGETLDDAEICLRPPGSGQITRFHVTARPLITDSGELRGGMVVFRDITEQKRAEHEILVSRSQWQSLVEHAPDFALNVDREGKVRFINRVAPGISLDQVIGTRLGADVSPEQQDRIQRALDACILRQLLSARAMIGVMLARPRGLWPSPEHGKLAPPADVREDPAVPQRVTPATSTVTNVVHGTGSRHA
jgi:PAS domain-containing protein